MFAHVSVNLEEGHITEVGTCDFEDIGTVFAEDARYDGTCDDTAHFEDFDSRENALVVCLWQRSRRCVGFQALNSPWLRL